MQRALVVAVETRALRETLEAELEEFEALAQAAARRSSTVSSSVARASTLQASLAAAKLSK